MHAQGIGHQELMASPFEPHVFNGYNVEAQSQTVYYPQQQDLDIFPHPDST
jgi:hypothetical protein